jgi:hypothetical protein
VVATNQEEANQRLEALYATRQFRTDSKHLEKTLKGSNAGDRTARCGSRCDSSVPEEGIVDFEAVCETALRKIH